jgi:hypothetical protein
MGRGLCPATPPATAMRLAIKLPALTVRLGPSARARAEATSGEQERDGDRRARSA